MEPRERKYFVTGDAIFEDRYAVLFLIPKSQRDWILFTFFGMLSYISDVDSWYTGGETTPEEATETFQKIWDSARYMTFLIGMISDFGAPLPDDSGWLQCDGTLYNAVDFPELYGAINDTYNIGGELPGTFRVPDLSGRVRATINSVAGRLPSWADDAGGAGGESDHTLTIGEMPSHAHTDAGHIHSVSRNLTGVALTPGELPVALPDIPFADATSTGNANLTNTGGDGPHNNVQPTMALYTYILAKF